MEEDSEVVGFVVTIPFEERGERRLNLVRLIITDGTSGGALRGH